MEVETLETERLLLKKLTPELFSQLFENYSETEAIKLLGLSTHEEYLKEKMKAEGGYKTYDRTILAFLIILKETNETIGRCGYHNWYLDHHKAEIGYHLHQDKHKRKGYMTEAVTKILDYGFNELSLNRIEANVAPDNLASVTLIKNFGFSQEGHLRQHYVVGEETMDSLIFSLLKEEYKHLNTIP